MSLGGGDLAGVSLNGDVRHLMIVTSAVPPWFMGGTPRLLRWCETLPAFGWRISVVGFSEVLFLERQDRIPAGTACYSIPFENPLSRVVKRFTERSGSAGFPDQFRPHMPRLLSEVRRVQALDPADIIMVTAGSFSLLDRDFLDGLHQLLPGRIVLDQRDMFSRNDEIMRSDADRQRAKDMEEQASKLIDGAIEVSPSYVEFARDWLGNKPVALLPNGFQKSKYCRVARHDPWPGRASNLLTFLFVGMAYGKAAPAYLIPGFLRAIEQRPALRDRLRFKLVGKYQPDALGDWSLLPDTLITSEQVPYSRIPQLLVNADVLTMVLGDRETMQGIPGAKVIEYLGADRPILAVTNGSAAEIVRSTKAGLTANPHDPESIARAVLELDGYSQENKPFPMGNPELRDPWEATHIAQCCDAYLRPFIK